MTMTPTEKAAALLDYANRRCNQEWTDATAPASVKLFIERAQVYLAGAPGIQSKRLGDASYTFAEGFPKDVLDLLPAPKVKFV